MQVLKEKLSSVLHEQKKFHSLPDIPFNVPSSINEEHIMQLLQLYNKHIETEPFNELKQHIDLLKKEMLCLQQEVSVQQISKV